MRPYVILRYIGLVLLLNAGLMFFSFLISVYNSDSAQIPLLLSFVLSALLGVFPMVFVPPTHQISNKEAYVIVVLGWLVVCAFGMLPYILWGGEFSIINAWFESVAGYTTTGSTILNDIEVLPNGLLFWRSATHWLGGIGIILFVLVIVPSLGKTRMSLSRLEMSPLAKTNFHYKTNKTLRVVILVYLGLTLTETLLLYFLGMSLFDAVTHTFGTVATGGFSPKNASIGYYNNVWIEIVIIVFMFLAGMHFGVLYTIFTFKNVKWYKSSVVKLYTILMIVGIVLVTINTKGQNYETWGEALRYSAFNVVSICTTTGYGTCDTTLWPPFSIMILIYFMFQCACAGSTAGGIKVDRVVIFYQSLKRQVLKLQHPQAVIPVRIDGQSIDDETVDSVLLFIVLYILILFITGLALTAMGVDLTTAFSASAATISTVGPGFGDVGSAANYSVIPDFGKFLLSINMLLGRLEIFGLMLLFFMKSWR
ncbi:MAG TPA: TrkH family potassium uptake protein [Tenuifilaceae bacterium]|nr:TrkH family potassium uptake protein [Tenuifilaceae bacterium]HPE18320.1 TrkH family potassium uptake protein [Tenuifilaceae bacterium]HPJ47098.1 TrkH family potassium uptake protein [Tenuifilaceae bacterium]HPQ33088.1 TrkH family potassium uptake protein [Tenuifilaceae bacterium]HRX68298.1 TrkH family potassium uptake protein [Tenuifilaceae bacterium]